MWSKRRKNLGDELMGIETPQQTIRSINFEKIIHSQQEVIKLLEKEITRLRQYLAYVADLSESSTLEKTELDTQIDLKTSSFLKEEKPDKKITGLKGLLN